MGDLISYGEELLLWAIKILILILVFYFTFMAHSVPVALAKNILLYEAFSDDELMA